VIGSMLQPAYVQDARATYAAGRMPAREFKRIEHRALDQVIAMQDACGWTSCPTVRCGASCSPAC
jgi:methionine synthase II (cobalamin-independent)